MRLMIRKLSAEDGVAIYNMLQEMPSDENGFLNPVAGKSYDEFKEWLKRAVGSSEQIGIIDGWKVPTTSFWLFEDDKPIGYGKIRHILTEKLLDEGGNIVYSICPSARNRGLGKEFVSGLIKEARRLGVDRLLFTIRNNNIPSIRVSLANGGVIEKITEERHYIWIKL